LTTKDSQEHIYNIFYHSSYKNTVTDKHKNRKLTFADIYDR